MTAHSEQTYLTVEKLAEGDGWVTTAFEDLREGEIVRFFGPLSKTPLERNGATLFLVVNEGPRAGSSGREKVSVVPYRADKSERQSPAQCPCFANIVVKPYGGEKLIEATGCCTQCHNMQGCLKARYSSEYFEQLRGALGLRDADN